MPAAAEMTTEVYWRTTEKSHFKFLGTAVPKNFKSYNFQPGIGGVYVHLWKQEKGRLLYPTMKIHVELAEKMICFF